MAANDSIVVAPNSAADSPRWAGESGLSQSQRFNPVATRSNLALKVRAQDLHEAAFGEKNQIDMERLSMSQQNLMLHQSQALEQAMVNRTKIQTQIRRNVSAAAAIEQMANLDHTDPKFEQKLSAVIAKYPDALASQGFTKFMADRRSDHDLYQKAEAARSVATFNEPLVQDAYAKALDQYKDPKLASIAAEATKQQLDKAKSLAVSTDLSPEDRATIYNPTTGTFDFSKLGQLEMKVNAAKATRTAQGEALKPLSVLGAALTHLNRASEDGETPELTEAKTNATSALVAYTNLLGGPAAAGTAAPAPAGVDPVANQIKKYLPTAATPSPTPEVTPPVVAAAAAAEPDEPAIGDQIH